MTEEAYFSSVAQKDAFKELDVEKYEIVATLDSHTSDICRHMDGKVYDMKEYEAGVTAPPFHVFCRSTTVPYFDDDFGVIGKRASRDGDGKTYNVPADMTYEEWEKQFVDKKVVAKSSEGGIMGVEKEENNKFKKGELVNRNLLDASKLSKRLQCIGEDTKVTRSIVNRAIETLKHREGTRFEDLTYIDSVSGKSIINKDYDFYDKERHLSECKPNRPMNEMLHQLPDYTVIGLHNHPGNGIPSLSDIMVAIKRKYKFGMVVCHSGMIYKYSARKGLNYKDSILQTNVDIQLKKLENSVKKRDKSGKERAIANLRSSGIDLEVIE